MNTINESPAPAGKLISQTIAMPRETNANGDIFGGWLLSQMDLAGAILAGRIAKGRVATVAISSMSFLNPVSVGAVLVRLSILDGRAIRMNVDAGQRPRTAHQRVALERRNDFFRGDFLRGCDEHSVASSS